MKHELNEIIAGMNSRLSDDESFMSELEARMDLVDRVKERNERLASKARKMVLRSILLGLLGAALILLGVPAAVTDLLEGHEASLWGVPGASLRGGTEESLRGGHEESLRTLSTDYSYSPSTYSVLSAILAACLYCLATLAFSLSFRFE